MNLLSTNLLARAQGYIPPVSVTLWVCSGASTSDSGGVTSTYGDAATVKMSIQAVPQSWYDRFGLDKTKTYVMAYYSGDLQSAQKGENGCDLIDYDSKRYTVESITNWKALNGWVGAICVYTGAAAETAP